MALTFSQIMFIICCLYTLFMLVYVIILDSKLHKAEKDNTRLRAERDEYYKALCKERNK